MWASAYRIWGRGAEGGTGAGGGFVLHRTAKLDEDGIHMGEEREGNRALRRGHELGPGGGGGGSPPVTP